MEAMAYELQDRLMSMEPEQTQAFHDILHIYEELADQYGLWDAASIMVEWCSDDGFIDFRAWLIAQGREVYLAALKDPRWQMWNRMETAALSLFPMWAMPHIDNSQERTSMKTQIPLPKRSGKPFWRQTSFIGKISDFPGRDRLCLPHIPGCAPNMEGQSDLTPKILAGTSGRRMCGRCWSRGNSMT